MKKIKNIIKYIDKKIDLKKFFKFGITGLLNTAIDWLVSSFLYYCFTVPSPTAKVIGQISAIINSYFINKHWTFKNNNKHKKSEILKFLVVQGISLGIGYAGMKYFNEYLDVNFILCQILIAGITIIINYFGNKLFVFK
ncbi:MAG: GtrA family protein [Oscillospiraceae bacterium]|nr:GtrA family protein [Oscillospiraceae bacterium]